MRVILNPMIADSVIGNGGPEGAFGDRLLVRGAQLGSTLYPMPDHMDFEVGALAEPLGVALHAVNRAQVRPGEKAVVFGCGPIGLGVVFWLGRRGVTDIVAIDPRSERLEKARQLGATATIQPGAENVAARLAALHGEAAVLGMPAVGSDLFIDAAGAASVVPDVVSMAKQHARLVVVAVHAEPVQIDLLRFLAAEISMTSSIGYPDEFPEVIATLSEIGDEARGLISHRFAFDQIFEALDVARTPASAKVMVHFDVG
jgi:threonine dehydrogenase-like Zn-dependent dehydrogenase